MTEPGSSLTGPGLKHWALLGYLVLVWGFAFALIAVALERFHPIFIVWSRLLMGALVMWCVWQWHAGLWTLGREWWPRLAMLSMTGNIIPFSLTPGPSSLCLLPRLASSWR